MGVGFVIRKTLIDLTSPRRMLGLVMIGLLVPVLVALGWRSSLAAGRLSLDMETYYVLSNFLTISFIWVAGFFLAFVVSTNAAGFISRESSDGTLLPLVTKPISRRRIVLGKLAALVVNAVLLEAIILVLLALILRFMLSMEMPTFVAVLGSIPWILLYSLLVVLVFGSISLALSALIESQVKIMVLVTVVVLFVFGFGLIIHSAGLSQELYERYHVYVVDMSYHLGNAFVPTLDRASGGQVLPASRFQFLQALTGIWEGEADPILLQGIRFSPYRWFQRPAELANHVSPAVSIIIWIAVIGASMLVGLRAMERKDVH